jgi:Na+/H+ antiporter NhaD/arsenite permease-like protein
LVSGVLCWTFLILGNGEKHEILTHLNKQMGEISGILFFLLGSMVVVELIDAHDGFQILTDRITTKNPRKLLWVTSILTFVLSAILANMTTVIVMISLLRKLISDKEMRMLFIGVVIIAANAGGAWSVLGDTTTTMLWMGGQISPQNLAIHLFLPSFICFALPVFIISRKIKGEIIAAEKIKSDIETPFFERNLILIIGLGTMLFVPIFCAATELPPFMAMLLGVGFLWIVTELIHKKKSLETRSQLNVASALQRTDTPSILFFLGILISISALQTAGILKIAAEGLAQTISNQHLVVILMGLLSAIVDNVPLVAALQGMFSLEIYPQNHSFWSFLAYAAGTGGSILIIGSAAGVAAMGMENIGFFWYLKRIAWLALVGFLAGAAVFMLL